MGIVDVERVGAKRNGPGFAAVAVCRTEVVVQEEERGAVMEEPALFVAD